MAAATGTPVTSDGEVVADAEKRQEDEEEPRTSSDRGGGSAGANGRDDDAATDAGDATTKDALDQILGSPYALPLPPFSFWIESVCIALQSVVLSFLSLGYLNVVYEVPKIWMSLGGNDGYPELASTTTFFAGKPIWIAIGAVSGLTVGLLKGYVFKFDKYDGFMEDLISLGEGTNPVDAAKVTITCLVGLCGNASMGPESGLGAACAGLSVVYARLVNALCAKLEGKAPEEVAEGAAVPEGGGETKDLAEKRRSKLIVLCGLVSCFASILPTPISAILLCIELPGFGTLSSQHGLEYTKTMAQSTLAGTLSFLVFHRFYGDTYLPPQTHIIPGFSHRYQASDVSLAAGIGLMGSILALVYFLAAGIVKAFANRMKDQLDKRAGAKFRTLVMATIGGTLFGTLGYIFPLTLGDGSYQLPAIYTSGKDISTSVLLSSAFIKMLAYWISAECGFVGGIFYPLLLISTLCGRVMINEFGTSWAITLACSLVALPAAFTPMPIAMALMAISTFNLSSRGGIPVLVCVVTAHALFVGIGIPHKLMTASKKKNQ